MAVIAQRERRRQISRQRLEARERRDPFVVGQRGEADVRGPAIVAMAQHVLRKPRGRDDIEERVAERGVQRIRAIGARDRHAYGVRVVSESTACTGGELPLIRCLIEPSTRRWLSSIDLPANAVDTTEIV